MMVTKWAFVAGFTNSPDDEWLLPNIRSEAHEFEIIVRPTSEESWHDRAGYRGTLRDWRHAAAQTRAALKTKPDGFITAFPPLTVTCGLTQRFTRRPIVAWLFNTGLYGPPRRQLARFAMGGVDRFVVHHRAEIEAYSHWLRLPAERFSFVPLQFDNPFTRVAPDDDDPFIFATGSGFRDYGTLFEAVGALGYRTLIVAGERILAGLTAPPNVEILEGVTRDEIIDLSQRARVNAIPLTEEGVVAGGVTMSQTLRLGRAMVVTDRPGVDDYVTDGETGLLVPPHDPRAFADALKRLWVDDSLRGQLNAGALRFGNEHLTDAAAAAELERILDEVVAERS
jgi:glycosyltransferase involved in cell wall biosynthesis